ncbi:hypothetical protein LJC02_01925 [Breznakia sp. OttesenSCG-928-G09]|nr:hypothetical protein [Breznakia sp. OttesenSCG-928-G09]
MLNVSDKFKQNMRTYGRQLDIRITYDDVILDRESIRSFSKTFNAEMFRCCMQVINCSVKGNHKIENKELKFEFGCKVDDEEYEYINWGNFIVDSETVEYDVESDTTKFTAYDKLLLSHVPYNLTNIVYPISVKEYLIAICNKIGLQYDANDFTNSNQLIDEEKYLPIPNSTYTDALDAIAGVAGGIIIISDDLVTVKYPTDIGTVVDEYSMKSFSVSSKWGEIESVTLAREPQEDNIIWPENSTDDMVNVRITNNQIMDKNREDYIVNIFDRVHGYYMHPFNVESSFGYFEPYDVITLKDLDGNTYQSTIMNNSISIESGITETISAEMPAVAKTDYSKATSIQKAMLQVQMYVDKQNGEIKAEIKDVQIQIDSMPNHFMSPFEPDNPKNNDEWIDTSSEPYLIKAWDEELGDWIVVGDYKGSIDDLQQQVTSIDTSLTINSGKIETLIKQNTTIINGEEVTLKEAYSYIQQQVDQINITVSETGGNNLLLNSAGWNSTNYWNVEEGNKVYNLLENSVGLTEDLSQYIDYYKMTFVKTENTISQSSIKIGSEGKLIRYLGDFASEDGEYSISFCYTTPAHGDGNYPFEFIIMNAETEDVLFYFDTKEEVGEMTYVNGTFTISNDGDYTIERFVLIIANGNNPTNGDAFISDIMIMKKDEFIEEYWQPHVSEVTPNDLDASSYTNVDIRNNTLSGYAFEVRSGTMRQDIKTIVGKKYNVSCKLKKFTNECYLKIINGTQEVYLFNLPGEVIADWTFFNVSFEALDSKATIEIGSNKGWLLISDIMANNGEIPQQWSSSNDEIYAGNVKIDKEGVEVSRYESNNRTIMNVHEFAGYDGNEVVFSLNGDQTYVNNLYAKNNVRIGEVQLYARPAGLDFAVIKR